MNTVAKRKRPAEVAAEGAVEVARQAERLATTTIKIAYDVWKAAKIRALEEGATLAGIIEKALRRYLEETEPGEER